jgi:hypothetical protein
MLICKRCHSEFPIKIKIDGKLRNLCRRKYCLKCSPLGGNNRRKLEKPEYHCRLCGKPSSTRRKLCYTCTSRIRRYRAKRAAVEYLGGVCMRCNWTGDLAGFEFHHLNDDKEFAIGNVSNRSWDAIVEELKKCELLCSTCHRIEHSGLRDAAFLAEVNSYSGRLLLWNNVPVAKLV